MSTATAPRLVVCTEYQSLLQFCQKSLTALQQQRTLLERHSIYAQRLREEVRRLQCEYERAYAVLEHHEHYCRECQYIAKVGGMDFESMSEAVIRRSPF
jgi:hypothetical protein